MHAAGFVQKNAVVPWVRWEQKIPTGHRRKWGAGRMIGKKLSDGRTAIKALGWRAGSPDGEQWYTPCRLCSTDFSDWARWGGEGPDLALGNPLGGGGSAHVVLLLLCTHLVRRQVGEETSRTGSESTV